MQTRSGSEREHSWQEAGPFISCGALSPGAPNNHNQVLLVTTATSSHPRDNTVSHSTHRHTGAVTSGIEFAVEVELGVIRVAMKMDVVFAEDIAKEKEVDDEEKGPHQW